MLCVLAAVAGRGDWARDRAAELVARMTLEECVSQLMMDSPAIPRLGVPKYHWWNEALHGCARAGLATVFPQTIGLAATFDEGLLRRVGETTSTEVRAKRNEFAKLGERGIYQGLTVWSPNVNMFRDPRWGRGQETYGEDPYLASLLGGAFVRGLQGDDGKWLKTAACAKHYAVHSGPERARHGFDAKVSPRDLAEYYLPAFESLVRDAKVEAVMSAYNRVNGTPCTASRLLLTDVLRGKWGFAGHVVSDVGAVEDVLTGHKFAKNRLETAKATIDAGLDLCSSTLYKCLYDAVKKGAVDRKTLEKPLINLFATRFRLGEFEPAGGTPWDSLGAKDVDTPQARALALEAAEKSLVLVKNDGLLPLDRGKCRYIGVTGERAMDEAALYGNYNGYSSRPSTVASGIAAEAGPAWRMTTQELNWADVVVACIGFTALDEGEEGAGGDRRAYSIPKRQLNQLDGFRRGRKKVVAVVFGGSPVNLDEIAARCNAVVLAWYPGEEGGRAVARAILGKTNFSGRLPVTYPKSYADLPAFEDYSLPGRTYLYAKVKPAYPFGYGLSYTTFAYSAATARMDGGRAVAAAKVRNTGKRAGDEVVQLYVQSPAGSGDRRVHHLAGVRRVTLAPGEEKEVVFSLGARELAVYGENGEPSVAKGEYTLHIGGGQPGFAGTVSAKFVPEGL